MALEKINCDNIRKRVLDNYGLTVTSLYVAQVKEKMGLEKGQNYNIGSDAGRVPHCPLEKEELSKEAFFPERIL